MRPVITERDSETTADCFWMRGFHWTDFEWDPAVFPDPRGMLARLKERGLKICVWINPYISQLSKLFAEGREHGYFIKRDDRAGSVYQRDKWHRPGVTPFAIAAPILVDADGDHRWKRGDADVALP